MSPEENKGDHMAIGGKQICLPVVNDLIIYQFQKYQNKLHV